MAVLMTTFFTSVSGVAGTCGWTSLIFMIVLRGVVGGVAPSVAYPWCKVGAAVHESKISVNLPKMRGSWIRLRPQRD